jgi:hypothetical protein
MVEFSERTQANMDVVLEEVCAELPNGGDHESRKFIAEQLIPMHSEWPNNVGRTHVHRPPRYCSTGEEPAFGVLNRRPTFFVRNQIDCRTASAGRRPDRRFQPGTMALLTYSFPLSTSGSEA